MLEAQKAKANYEGMNTRMFKGIIDYIGTHSRTEKYYTTQKILSPQVISMLEVEGFKVTPPSTKDKFYRIDWGWQEESVVDGEK